MLKCLATHSWTCRANWLRTVHVWDYFQHQPSLYPGLNGRIGAEKQWSDSRFPKPNTELDGERVRVRREPSVGKFTRLYIIEVYLLRNLFPREVLYQPVVMDTMGTLTLALLPILSHGERQEWCSAGCTWSESPDWCRCDGGTMYP